MPTMDTQKIECCRDLMVDHRLVEGLFEKLLSDLDQSTPDWQAAQACLDHIYTEMNTHFACEEQVLFPAVELYHPMVLMEAEHEMLYDLVHALQKEILLPQNIEGVRALAQQFVSEMLDHIGREDHCIFPTIEQTLKEDVKA